MKVDNGSGKFVIKLVPINVSREHTIGDIISSLDNLSEVTNNVFSCIQERLKSHRDRVNLMTNRVSKAVDTITQLKASGKAIRVVSAAKFPVLNGDSSSSLLSDVSVPILCAKKCSIPRKLEEDVSERRRYIPPISNPEDARFHMKEQGLGDLVLLDTAQEIGVGQPPSIFQHIESYFLFNTAENPYTSYRISEKSSPVSRGGFRVRKGDEAQPSNVPGQNESITANTTIDKDDFYYYPSSLQIPTIDFPDHLPDLPGLPDNLDLPAMVGIGGSPFFFQRPSELPTVMNVSTSKESNILASPSSWSSSEISSISTPVSEEPIATSSKMTTPATTANKKEDESSKVTVTSPTSPPAPPPPPPMQPMTSSQPPAPVQVGSGGSDMMSNLMAAIRQAGGKEGAKLRSAKDRKYEAKKKKQEEKEKVAESAAAGDVDLISDLKNALSMRRRGISGMKDGQKQAAGLGDIMQRLVSTIPSLEESTESIKNPGSDDDDWD